MATIKVKIKIGTSEVKLVELPSGNGQTISDVLRIAGVPTTYNFSINGRAVSSDDTLETTNDHGDDILAFGTNECGQVEIIGTSAVKNN